MNLPVRVPAGTEAAALGGAIQALWALNRKQGSKVSIEALAEEHVALEGGATVKPDPRAVKAYNQAYEIYSGYLAALSPLYR
jgi:xylulokinase